MTTLNPIDPEHVITADNLKFQITRAQIKAGTDAYKKWSQTNTLEGLQREMLDAMKGKTEVKAGDLTPELFAKYGAFFTMHTESTKEFLALAKATKDAFLEGKGYDVNSYAGYTGI